MAINSYTTLLTTIATWTSRTDLGGVADDFIDLTEATLNRELRVSQQEVRATTPATSEYLAFPIDALAIRNIQLNTTPVRELQYVTPAEMDALDDNGTTLNYYTIVGDEIQLQATSDYSLEISYYAKIPSLGYSNEINWLIESNPDLYLYGCLAFAFKFIQDDEQATIYAQRFADTIRSMNSLDKDRKYSQSLQVRVG